MNVRALAREHIEKEGKISRELGKIEGEFLERARIVKLLQENLFNDVEGLEIVSDGVITSATVENLIALIKGENK